MYEDSTAVLGPLSRISEPHAYDLCQEHASRMTAPRGWELLRVAGSERVTDDLVALAEAVSRRPDPEPTQAPSAERMPSSRPPSEPRRTEQGESSPARHLHVVRSPHD